MRESSKVCNEVTNAQFQCLRDLGQRFHCDLVFGAFNVPNVIARQICLLCQLFLTQTGFDPLGSDCLAENFGYFAALRHSLIANQELLEGTTKHTWYFSLAAPYGSL